MKTIQFKQSDAEMVSFKITNLERLDGAKVYVNCALEFLKACDKEKWCNLSTFEWVRSLKRTLKRVDTELDLIIADQKILRQRDPWEHSNG